MLFQLLYMQVFKNKDKYISLLFVYSLHFDKIVVFLISEREVTREPKEGDTEKENEGEGSSYLGRLTSSRSLLLMVVIGGMVCGILVSVIVYKYACSSKGK